MTYSFDRAVMRPGDIVHRRSYSTIGWAIRNALGNGCWGNHDALWIPRLNYDYIGDAQPPRAVLTEISDYESDMDRGRCECRVYRPAGATPIDGIAAGNWWRQNVLGIWYDLSAFPDMLYRSSRFGRLLVKALWGDRWPEQWEWAWYCTEGISRAWQVAGGIDIYGAKLQPTPLTTEKRLASGQLTDVTADAIISQRSRKIG